MFGLIFFAGFGLLLCLLTGLYRVVLAGALKLKLKSIWATTLSLAVVIMAAFSPSLNDIIAVHGINQQCELHAGREITSVVKDVEGIRVDGYFDPTSEVLALVRNYSYYEVTNNGQKRRINSNSSAICGPQRTCEIEDFFSRYLLSITKTKIDKRITKIEQTAVDTETGSVLGKETEFHLDENRNNSNLAISDLFWFGFRLPAMLMLSVNKKCWPRESPGFVNAVFVPSHR